MLYDCFTFFNENDLLELRLNYLNEVVDKFIIVESNKTFSGEYKPKIFDEKRFEKFSDKIIYVYLENLPENLNPWYYENFQRNYVQNLLEQDNAKPDDIVIVSDLDEIPSVSAIKEYLQNPDGIKSFQQKFYNFYLNLYNETESPWTKAKIFRYEELNNEIGQEESERYRDVTLVPECNIGQTPTKIRIKHRFNDIPNGGWHFSYLGGAEAIKYKIESFAHQEFNKEEITNLEHINRCLTDLTDVLGRKNVYKKVDINSNDFPQYLVENLDKFKKYILE